LGFILLLGTFLYLSSAGAQPPKKVNTIDLTTAIADVAQAAMPAVVHIEVTQRVQVPSPVFPFEGIPSSGISSGSPETAL